MPIQILVNGANGKMGQEVVNAVKNDAALTLVGTSDKNDNLAEKIKSTAAQVVIDFTHPSVVYQNTKIILENNAHPVIGTTGFTLAQINELKKISAEKKLGGIIAPNFSIGAVLMMKYSQDAARYFPNVEIIELHHDAKADSPSGTAIKTAEMINAVKHKINSNILDKAIIPNARGAVLEDIHIHAIRLPGFVANQEVIFGGLGETLKIAHSTIHRNAFMPGVILACKKVQEFHEILYGLENML